MSNEQRGRGLSSAKSSRHKITERKKDRQRRHSLTNPSEKKER